MKNTAGADLSPEKIYEAFLKYETLSRRKTIPCEQAHGYVYYVREILHLFSEANIINTMRDPRDVLLSEKNRRKRQFLSRDDRPLWLTTGTWMIDHPVSTSALRKAAI